MVLFFLSCCISAGFLKLKARKEKKEKTREEKQKKEKEGKTNEAKLRTILEEGFFWGGSLLFSDLQVVCMWCVCVFFFSHFCSFFASFCSFSVSVCLPCCKVFLMFFGRVVVFGGCVLEPPKNPPLSKEHKTKKSKTKKGNSLLKGPTSP